MGECMPMVAMHRDFVSQSVDDHGDYPDEKETDRRVDYRGYDLESFRNHVSYESKRSACRRTLGPHAA